MDNFHSVPASQLKAVAKLGEGTFGEVLQCTNRLFGDIAVKCAKVRLSYPYSRPQELPLPHVACTVSFKFLVCFAAKPK